MADYLVDTNHLSVLVTQEHPLRANFVRQMKFGESFAIAAPALAEMLFGLHMTPRAKQNIAEWMRLSIIFTYHNIERVDAELAANLQAELRRHGWQLGTVDALLAAVALRYHLTLLATDRDFQRVPGLNVQNWLISEAT